MPSKPPWLQRRNCFRRQQQSVKYTGVGKSRATVVHMGKDMKVLIITIDLLIQKNVTTANLLLPTAVHICVYTYAYINTCMYIYVHIHVCVCM